MWISVWGFWTCILGVWTNIFGFGIICWFLNLYVSGFWIYILAGGTCVLVSELILWVSGRADGRTGGQADGRAGRVS